MSQALKSIIKKQDEIYYKRRAVPLVQVNLGKMKYNSTRPSSQTNRTRYSPKKRDRSIIITKHISRSQKDLTLLKVKPKINNTLSHTICSFKENNIKGCAEQSMHIDISNDVINETGINLVKEVLAQHKLRLCVSHLKISLGAILLNHMVT